MKFVFAVVMLALAVGVQSSLIAPIALGWGHGAPAAVDIHGWGGHWGGPWAGAWGPAVGAWGPAVGHWGQPGISLSQGPGHLAAPVAIAHDLGLGHGHGHDGVYVAKTRGAIHKAPLAGHINSATSLNVAPAPGTH